MQRILRFIVEGQEIKKDPTCDFSNIVANSKGYLVANFAFLGDWAGMQKVGIFCRGGSQYAVRIIDNECAIPAEALTHTNFNVCVLGVKDNTQVFTNKVIIRQI